jgi:hypothetical protein
MREFPKLLIKQASCYTDLAQKLKRHQKRALEPPHFHDLTRVAALRLSNARVKLRLQFPLTRLIAERLNCTHRTLGHSIGSTRCRSWTVCAVVGSRPSLLARNDGDEQ